MYTVEVISRIKQSLAPSNIVFGSWFFSKAYKFSLLGILPSWFVYSYTTTNIDIHKHLQTSIYINTYKHRYKWTPINIYICTYIDVHTNIYIYRHVSKSIMIKKHVFNTTIFERYISFLSINFAQRFFIDHMNNIYICRNLWLAQSAEAVEYTDCFCVISWIWHKTIRW